jgi:hypothetical protein
VWPSSECHAKMPTLQRPVHHKGMESSTPARQYYFVGWISPQRSNSAPSPETKSEETLPSLLVFEVPGSLVVVS